MRRIWGRLKAMLRPVPRGAKQPANHGAKADKNAPKCRNCGAVLDYGAIKCDTCGRKTVQFNLR